LHLLPLKFEIAILDPLVVTMFRKKFMFVGGMVATSQKLMNNPSNKSC
jgi:hypothetical protein